MESGPPIRQGDNLQADNGLPNSSLSRQGTCTSCHAYDWSVSAVNQSLATPTR